MIPVPSALLILRRSFKRFQPLAFILHPSTLLLPIAFALLCPILTQAAPPRPNIVLILADDLGFSDIGSYGSEIRTPNLDAIAAKGLRFTQFYTAARCCPSRASLLTGLYPHQAHVGNMVDEYARKVRETLNSPAYSDRLNPHAPTIAEALRAFGYRTAMSGKWHLGYRTNEWPVARGFDRSFAVIEGAMNYYGFGIQHTGLITNPPMALYHEVFLPPREGFFATDAFTDFALNFIRAQKGSPTPFFLYLPYTAPHWPLHARPETVAQYRGKYKAVGWDKTRQQRYERLIASGIIDPRWPLTPRPANVRPWEDATPERQETWDHEMAIYAAQVHELDHAIGQVLRALCDSGHDQNTLVLFLSDNGGAAEDPNRSLPGAPLNSRDSYEGYGIGGAHISSSPFRKTKKFSHEGGIASPLIAFWPSGIAPSLHGTLHHSPTHLIDLLPTCLDVAQAKFPRKWNGTATLKPEGRSLTPAFTSAKPLSRSQPLFWEHEGHRAVRDARWKLVASHNEPWELYDLQTDRTESTDLSSSQSRIATRLINQYKKWATRASVQPWP